LNEGLQSIVNALPFLIPLLVIELALMVIALLDVIKREHVRGGNQYKPLWIVLIVLVSLFGPIIYLLFGRQEAPNDRD
jgi:hypothetical protein